MRDMHKDILSFLPKKADSIAIAGLNKNAGKTVTLMYLMEKLSYTSYTIGTTSIGFDGERKDMIFGNEKPEFRVPKNTYIATASAVLSNYRGEYEIIKNTFLQSPLGEIYIIKSKTDSSLEIVGPSSLDGLEKVKKMLLEYVDLVLIDGAYNRITQISPKLCTTAILAVGGDSLSKSIKELSRLYNLFNLQTFELFDLEAVFETENCAIICDGKLEKATPSQIGNYNVEYCVWNGALTDHLVNKLLKKCEKIVVEDLTKVFISAKMLKSLMLKQRLYVHKHIDLVFCTYNPQNFYGSSMGSYEFGKKVSEEFPSIDFCDVNSSYCFKGGKLDGYLG